MSYQCPVCGYPHLPEPPRNYEICPSCGTEFGLDDSYASHRELREAWMARGAQWWSEYQSAPPNWDGVRQLIAAGHLVKHTTPTTLQTWGQSVVRVFFDEQPVRRVLEKQLSPVGITVAHARRSR